MRSPEMRTTPSGLTKRDAVKAALLCIAAAVTDCSKADEQLAQAQEAKPVPVASQSSEPVKVAKPICPKRPAFNPPVIGFSGDIRNPEELGDRTKRWVAQAGGKAIRMSPTNLEQTKCNVDGIVLSGGNDIPGQKFGEPSHPSIKSLEEGRYEFDMKLIELAEQVRLPIMGVCLGSQELWVREGGKLVQDIPSAIQAPLNHRQPHKVTFSADSFLRGLYPDGLEAWSNHHQSNDAVGSHDNKNPTDVFNIVGHSSDGVVEAMESKEMNKRFVLGIQWHPTDDSGVKLYRAFIDRAKKKE